MNEGVSKEITCVDIFTLKLDFSLKVLADISYFEKLAVCNTRNDFVCMSNDFFM